MVEEELKKQLEEELRTKIKALRKEIGCKTQEELAKRLNIPVEDIKAYESGKKPVPLSYATKLCELAGVQVRYLLSPQEIQLSYRGEKKQKIKEEMQVKAIQDGLKILKEQNLIKENRLDYIDENNPEIAASHFIEYYGLKNKDFNTFEIVRKKLAERDIFVFSLPIDTSALVVEEDPFFIIINSKEPKDRWSFSLLHEIGHLIAPPEIKKKKNFQATKRKKDFIEDYADIFAGAVLIPKEYRYTLWNKLGKYIENRNYIKFFEEVRELNDFVSPEAVFLALIREFMEEPDYKIFGHFRKIAKEIRNKEEERQGKKEKDIPKEYIQRIKKLKNITEGRKNELVNL